MNKNYRALTQTIKDRLNPESILLEKSFSDELGSIPYDDVLDFVRYAMKGVDPQYTQKSIEAGNRVKDHLINGNLANVEYRFQGSVMTNTHIRGYSDIDLLCISDKFSTWASTDVSRYLTEASLRQRIGEVYAQKLEHKRNTSSKYQGNYLQDLKNIRLTAEAILSDIYSVIEIDKPKSIKITNTNLKRDVDIVTAGWYDDVRAIMYETEVNRGVQVYNKESHSTESADYPFVSIERINARSSQTNGRLKRMIRFLKNVRSLSKKSIELSSFDINAICYDINVDRYKEASIIELVVILHDQLNSITTDPSHADRILSVDDREYVFKGRPSKIASIKLILDEISQVYIDIPKNTSIYS